MGSTSLVGLCGLFGFRIKLCPVRRYGEGPTIPGAATDLWIAGSAVHNTVDEQVFEGGDDTPVR
jgi:hypothetical protein